LKFKNETIFFGTYIKTRIRPLCEPNTRLRIFFPHF